ncbi:MAG TPA: hypothetical protein ENL42_04135, partial [Thermoplasmatales archaeon]|nr:hypothetical protein [Thermoplasmatales archaeon]
MKKAVSLLSALFLLSILFQNGISPYIYTSKITGGKIPACKMEKLNFFNSSKSDFYIVGVSSPNKIYVNDFSFLVWGNISGKANGVFFGGVIMNKTTILYGGPFGEYTVYNGLNYLHFKIGSINYTYNNYPLLNYSFENASLCWLRYSDIVLPPGEWYFVTFICWQYTSSIEKDLTINVWIN